MESSMTLLSAHIQFLDTQLALIHIPLHLYSSFLQSILQLLLPSEAAPKTHHAAFNGNGNGNGNGAVQPPAWPSEHPFVNISVTPIECSVVCSRKLADELFVPARDRLDEAARRQVSITAEDYVVMQVDGEGLDAGQRVLELTSPLALAGISIFFITTYFSDYILVPLAQRTPVIHALVDRGFRFEHQTSSYTLPSTHHSRTPSSSSLADLRQPSTPSSSQVGHPSTPPPTTVSGLQARTFATLSRCAIRPTVDPTLRLVQCAAPTAVPSASLHLGLVRCLIALPRASFLSLTLTDAEPASLLLDAALLPAFPAHSLLGSRADFLVPITLDLRGLPVESTGIVCGVAGRLVGGTLAKGGGGGGGDEGVVEMSYLSTARAGTVMVGEGELERAMGALTNVSAD